jgi:hypothetical protein
MLRARSGAPGFQSPRSAAPPTAPSTHILPALDFASQSPYTGLQKRHIQPERYAKYNFEINKCRHPWQHEYSIIVDKKKNIP